MQQSTRNTTSPTLPATVREFEGDTVEEALEQVTSQLGSDARVVDVERVARGGVGGFFARESVVVRATPPAGPAPAPVDAQGPPRQPVVKEAHAGGIDAVLTRMAAEQDEAERDFRARLDQHLEAPANEPLFESPAWPTVERAQTPPAAPAAPAAPHPAPHVRPAIIEEEIADADVEVVAAPAPAPVAAPAPAPVAAPAPAPAAAPAPAPTAAPAPAAVARPSAPRRTEALALTSGTSTRARTPRAHDAPDGAGPVEWSALNLQRLGLPASVIDAVWNIRSDDDFVWLRAVADAVKLFCRPLPGGASMLVGPRGKRLAEALSLPAVKKGEAPPYGGHVGIQCKDHKTDRQWLREVAGERWLHVVIGGNGWQGLLFEDPMAVSWVGTEELPEALDLCAKLGLVLGYGVERDTKDAIALRAAPFEVALAIRSLLPRT